MKDKDNEIALRFIDRYIIGKIKYPTETEKDKYFYVVRIPNLAGDNPYRQRTFTIDSSIVHTDKKREFKKFAYIDKNEGKNALVFTLDENNHIRYDVEYISNIELVEIFDQDEKERFIAKKNKEASERVS